MSFFLPNLSTQYLPLGVNLHPISILYILFFFFASSSLLASPAVCYCKSYTYLLYFYTSTLRCTSVDANISVSQLFRFFFSIILILWRCYDSAPLMGPTPSGWWQTRGSFRRYRRTCSEVGEIRFYFNIYSQFFFCSLSLLPTSRLVYIINSRDSRFLCGGWSGNSITLSWNIFFEHVSFYIREFSFFFHFSWFALEEFQIREA